MKNAPIPVLLFLVLLPSFAFSQPQKVIRKTLATLETLEEQVRQNALPVLVMIKELEQGEPEMTRETAKVINPTAMIHESDLRVSQVLVQVRKNEEFPILEKRDEWYQIRLQDGRQGWIHENAIQVILTRTEQPTPEPVTVSQTDIRDLVTFAADWIQQINTDLDSAKQIYAYSQSYYQELSQNQKQKVKPIYQSIRKSHEKIIRSASYVNHFYSKYAALYTEPGRQNSFLNNTSGQLKLQLGSSSYESAREQSVTSRNIGFNARKELNEYSAITASLGNQKQVVQTPYSIGNYRIGYSYRKPKGLTFSNYVSLDNYQDELSPRNSYNQWNAGIRLIYPMSTSWMLYNDMDYLQKSLEDDGINSYQGGRFHTGFKYTPNNFTQWTLATRGQIQSSDAAYLDFNRFIPQINYRRKGRNGYFNARLEMDQISYNEDAERNNYQRERLNLTWKSTNSTKRLMLIGKQYPNNQQIDYIKLGGQIQGYKRKNTMTSRSNFYLLLVYFPQMSQDGGHYMDIRWDRSTSRSTFYSDSNIFARVFNQTDKVRRYHLLDFYQSMGLSFGAFRIGPLLGAHLMIHKDEEVFKRDGNSLRTGLDVQGNFIIQKATLNISARYEYDFLFGEELEINPLTGEITRGEVITRNPTTLQLLVDFRVPVSRQFDFQVLVNKYQIELDLEEEISIDPVSTRDRTNVLAGLVYRFGR